MCGSMEKAHAHTLIISIANVINPHLASVREFKRRLFQTLYTFGNETTILANRKTKREYAVSSTGRIFREFESIGNDNVWNNSNRDRCKCNKSLCTYAWKLMISMNPRGLLRFSSDSAPVHFILFMCYWICLTSGNTTYTFKRRIFPQWQFHVLWLYLLGARSVSKMCFRIK